MLEEEEKEQNWFTRWDKDLPNPEDLIPLSQSLITPDLALAFHIQSPNPNLSAALHTQSTPANFDSSPVDGVSAADEPSRMSKRPRLVWTPQLHKRFVDAVAQLGIKNAVPKTIMQLMSVDGLTRENVASHLQKYRLYLKRMQGMQGLSSSAGAAEQLFASTPVENPFLGAGSGQEKFMQFMAPALIQNQQHMAQQQFYRQREMGHFGGYDDGFQRRMMGCSGLGLGISSPSAAVPNSCGEDFDSGSGGRRILTLFPTSSED